MAQTYEPELLAAGTPESLGWAIAWYRFLAGDKPVNDVYPQFSLDDDEIEGLLRITSIQSGGVRYYLPHEALASKILSDPSYAVQISEESYSQTFVTPNKVAENIRSIAERHFSGLYPSDVASRLGFNLLRLTPRF